MRKLILFIAAVFVMALPITAQPIEEWIKEKKPLLFEKLYLHVDRDLYAPGDKIWIKAYQVNGITHALNANYRNIFVQLVNDSGQVVKDLLLFSEKGQAQGCLAIDSLPGGRYTIRAFTRYLQNFGEQACFHKKIWISGNDQWMANKENAGQTPSPIEVAFLPEGGNMVLNAANTVAFKAIDTKGRGVDIKGWIVDDRGDTITSFQSLYQGMGKLIIMPVEERSYFALVDQYPSMKIRLEDALADGINLKYSDMGESLRFTMASNMKVDKRAPYYFVASHKGIVLFYKKMEGQHYNQSLNLIKNLFPKGISKISLLDTAFNVFAERLVFVDDGKPDLVNLQLKSQEFSPREKISIQADVSFAPDDSLTSPLSVAIVNKNYLEAGGSSQNIKSYLLLDAELKGPLERPSMFFVDEAIKSSEKLDLLMMIHGWRSYIWDEVAKVDTATVEDWNDAGIEIRGFVKKLLWKAPLPEAELTLASRGGNHTIDKTTSNEKGRFSFKRVYLSNITRVTINALTKNGTRNAEIRLDKELRTDTIQTVGSLAATCLDVNLNRDFYSTNSFRKMKERDYNPEDGSILLGDVEVRRKRSLHDDGHFRLYSNPDKSLAITEEDYQYNNVLDYLEGRIAGLTISGDEVSMRGGGQPLFLIDGMEIEAFDDPTRVIREVRNLRMTDIDKVEVLKGGANLVLYGAQGGNGVIAIYRKTIDKIPYTDNHVNGRLETTLKGFHKAPKFYAPSYTPENINDPKPDYRPTLLWDPELSFKDGKANIEFCTSDELARYVVFVEGITKNGRICYGTTNFVVDKK